LDEKDISLMLDSLGIETSAFKILCHLTFSHKEVKPAEISDKLSMKPGTVRARLSELKEAKLVSMDGDGYISNLTAYDIITKVYKQTRKDISEAMKSERREDSRHEQ